MNLKVLFAISCLAILSGCGTRPVYNELQVQDAQVVTYTLPPELTNPCIPDKPLEKSIYLKLRPYEREQYLTDYSTSLLGTIKGCNIKLEKIKKINKPKK